MSIKDSFFGTIAVILLGFSTIGGVFTLIASLVSGWGDVTFQIVIGLIMIVPLWFAILKAQYSKMWSILLMVFSIWPLVVFVVAIIAYSTGIITIGQTIRAFPLAGVCYIVYGMQCLKSQRLKLQRK